MVFYRDCLAIIAALQLKPPIIVPTGDLRPRKGRRQRRPWSRDFFLTILGQFADMHAREWVSRQITGIPGGIVSKNHAIDFNLMYEETSFGAALFEAGPSEVEFDIFNKNKICLVFALMLSLGLWAIIGVAVAVLIGAGPS